MQTGYSAVWREDLPRHVDSWHCEACSGTACEVTTEHEPRPKACPYGHVPDWRLDRWRRERRCSGASCAA
jgi:hypothetical protein